ncbi:MAG: hypothetical protein ABIG90_02455, partial [bacterium]
KEEYKKDLESKATNITTNIANNQIRNIEALALFAAFFTFVAINVQVFSQVENLRSAMWFSLLLLGCLGFFALLVHVIINTITQKAGIWQVIILAGVFAILILIALWRGGDEKLYQSNGNPIKIENQGASVQVHDNEILVPKDK